MNPEPEPRSLPEPEPHALEHSRVLAGQIRGRIAEQGGWLDFSEYMALALYAPGLGYYSAGAARFGAAGDFVTAPELGPQLAHGIAGLAERLSASLGRIEVLELGAGSGALAADLLADCHARGCLPERYRIVEVSADLREAQRRRLTAQVPELSARVEWLDELPSSVDGLVLANEVMDALPCSRFEICDGAPRPLGVAAMDDGFGWSVAPPGRQPDSRLAARLAALPALPETYRSEYCAMLPGWLTSLGETLQRGALLLGDYGCSRRDYYSPGRHDGSLLCYYRHTAHADPFRWPGLQDITAWVDFTAVAEALSAAGLKLDYYTTQAQFLIAHGLADAGHPASDLDRAQQAAVLRQLLMPGEMGEHFKYLLASRGVELAVPAGLRDFAHQL
jgi:SAM-dependent MidA family methyltransferase